MGAEVAGTGYKFNEFSDIKSHSSILYNNRLAYLFFLLDIDCLTMHATRSPQSIKKVQSLLTQIYKNVRSLLRMNPAMRHYMNLNTKVRGVYITDVAKKTIDNMIRFCETNSDGLGWTERRVYIIIDHMEEFEEMIKDCLQYFSYFIRAEFKLKPDFDIATERFKEFIKPQSIEQIKSLVGKNNKIDWTSLGLVNADGGESKRLLSPMTVEDEVYVEDFDVNELADDSEDGRIPGAPDQRIGDVE